MTDQHPEPVIVATYSDRGEAEVSRAHLAASGIEAFIIDGTEGGTLPSGEGNGVAVLVPAGDADTARSLLGTDTTA